MPNCTQYILKTWLFLLLSQKISGMHIAFLFQSVIIYLYLLLSIYIYHYIFILIIIYLYLWFIIQSVVGVIGIVGNILTILVLSTKVRNRQWGELFEKLEMMRIILCLKYWQCGGLFCVLYKSFFSKIEFKFSAECTHLGPLKKFCNPFAIFLIFSDERQTTKRWSINFLLIGSLFLFLQCCNMLKLSGALCKCRLKAWQFNFVDIFSSQSVSIYFF